MVIRATIRWRMEQRLDGEQCGKRVGRVDQTSPSGALLGTDPRHGAARRWRRLGFVSITVAALSEANEADAGLASGMVTTAQQVGGALGLAVLVSIATTRASNLLSSGHPPAMAQLSRSHLAFAVGAGILAMGAGGGGPHRPLQADHPARANPHHPNER